MSGFTGGFVIPTTRSKGSDYYFFGLEKNGKLSGFGGRRNSGEKLRATAVRELHEESLGVFCKRKELTHKMRDLAANKITKVDTFPSTTYIVPLKLKKKRVIKKFDKRRSSPTLKKVQKEMTKIIAVKASEIRAVVHANPHNIGFQGHRARGLLAKTLQTAVASGVI